MGIFGNSASILVDVNLILQYVTLILLIVGYVKRKPFKNHGRIMITVTLITVATILLIMAPALIAGFGLYAPTILAHAALGLVAMLLGALFSTRFILAVRSGRPLACGTKNMMRFAFVLWLIPIVGGTALYFQTYVMV